MEDKVNYSLVGAFVLSLGAALTFAILWLATGLSGQKRYDPYQTVVVESVAGLSIDAPVKYLGVDVGKVIQIGIDPQNPTHVRLRFQIERGTPIKQDTEAVLKTQGLTGIGFIELSGGSVDSPPLTPSIDNAIPTIRSKPSLSARLEDVLTNVLANLDRTSANLNALLDDDNRSAVKTTLASTAALAKMLAQQQDTIRTGIDDGARTASNSVQASAQLAPLLKQMAPLLKQMASALAPLGPALAKLDPLIKHIDTSADGFDAMTVAATRSIAALDRTAQQAATGVQQLNIETLPSIDRLLNELNELAPSLRRLTEQIERQPNSVLIGGARRLPGPGEALKP